MVNASCRYPCTFGILLWRPFSCFRFLTLFVTCSTDFRPKGVILLDSKCSLFCFHLPYSVVLSCGPSVFGPVAPFLSPWSSSSPHNTRHVSRFMRTTRPVRRWCSASNPAPTGLSRFQRNTSGGTSTSCGVSCPAPPLKGPLWTSLRGSCWGERTRGTLCTRR